MESLFHSRKVVIVGAGDVGASFAFALMQRGLADDIALVDVDTARAEAHVMDLAHGLPFVGPVKIHLGTRDDYRDAAVIVIAAGARQRPGESRHALLARNAAIVSGIVDNIVASRSQAILVMVSNPVDVLTHVALRASGFPRQRVIGSGTVLDSARFRYLLGTHCQVDVRSVHAYILGEHGDSEVPAWSMTNLAGMSMRANCLLCPRRCNWALARRSIVSDVRHSAYHVIAGKGSTCFAIGLALVRIVGAILRDERSLLTVSVLLRGEYGLNDVCLSVPCVVARNGAERIIEATLSGSERAALARSAETLGRALRTLSPPAGGAPAPATARPSARRPAGARRRRTPRRRTHHRLAA